MLSTIVQLMRKRRTALTYTSSGVPMRRKDFAWLAYGMGYVRELSPMR